ncbi:MAG: hypothetical protein KDH94_05865, partial [Coxiellaceae bacterium]|nr:hypothetical protein [Coxiellaceae bacterium]
MVTKKVVFAGAAALLGSLVAMPQAIAQTGGQQQFVSAEPSSSQTVTANSDSSVQPSTSNTTAPGHLSSALGIGPKSRIHINGFLSTGLAWTDTNAEYVDPNHGTIDNEMNWAPLSLVGLQFTADLARHLQVVTQLVGDGDDTDGNVAYRLNVEWAFLRYAVNENYQIEIGRFRLPAFTYSLTEQVGYSYPWVMLPDEVYRIVPFNNVNGITFITRHPLFGAGWNITSQIYYGGNKSRYDVYNAAFPTGVTVDFDESALAGIVLSIGNSNFTIRGSYATLKLSGDFKGVEPLVPPTTLFSSVRTTFYSIGAKLNFWHFLLMGEFASRQTPDNIAALNGYYGSLGLK